jgi:hypothetical protein
MQSNLFFIDVVALRALDWRIRASEIDIWIRERLDGSFFGPEIGNALQSRVRDWLFKPGLRAWYAAGPLTDGNLGAMAAKARAVLQEHYFSMRLQSEGVLVVPPSLGFLQDKWMKFVDACGMLARYCGLKLKIGR